MSFRRLTILSTLSLGAIAGIALSANASGEQDLTSTFLNNRTAYIPSQCYTKTRDDAGEVHNPCFTCHVRSRAPNYVNDRDLQLAYDFPGPALKNPWSNLFVDRRPLVDAISDKDIVAYIRQDNYRDADGMIILASRLQSPPPGWDFDKDGSWAGFVPDVHFDFDEAGFDHAPDGSETGWRAFAYTPAPGTFWPAAGSADDVLIRLPAAYRQTQDGAISREVYQLNLAIVEALIKRHDIGMSPADETEYGIDLDKDGTLGTADHIAYAFDPRNGVSMSYVGLAATLGYAEAPLAAGLYPLGTEFAHSVRYVDIDDEGSVRMAPRMKEFRYMKKTTWATYGDLEEAALAEIKEASDFPNRIRLFDGNVESGIDNATGWRLQGFIEDANGDLRPQTFEETVFCMGCHGGVGVTDDSTFAFPRKLAYGNDANGWRHTGNDSGLYAVPDPKRADGRPEYQTYLEQNHAGDEFRSNNEIIARFFAPDGSLDPALTARMNEDISALINPSPERALLLDKAYRTIVMEQSYDKGRDANVTSLAMSVHREVEDGEPTGIETPIEPWFFQPPQAE